MSVVPFVGDSYDVHSFIRDRLAAYDDIALEVDRGAPIVAANVSIAADGAYAGIDACIRDGLEEQTAAANLASYRVAMVAASGNGGAVDRVSRPACLPDVVSVAAVNGADLVLDFSNVGPQLDFFATGYHERVAAVSGTVMASGTSFASPIVAGLLGSVLASDGSLSVQDAVGALTGSGEPVLDQRSGSVGTVRPRVPGPP